MSQIEDIVAGYRVLVAHGIIDAYGHVSVRSESDPSTYLLARSVAPEIVLPSDIITYDLDSNPLDANGRDSVKERFIHGEIYKVRPDVTSVVHNHSPTVVPFSVTGVQLRPLFHMAAFVGQGMPLFEVRDFARDTDLLVGNAMLGEALAKVLGDAPAALMRGHGAVVVGENIARSVGRSVYLELSAKMQLQAMALAWPTGEINWLDEGEVRASVPVQDYYRAWPMWRDKALAGLKASAEPAKGKKAGKKGRK
jgi:ribulose-5-phosphate 4-epimerase/fuculose-1-phosphate aldolase